MNAVGDQFVNFDHSSYQSVCDAVLSSISVFDHLERSSSFKLALPFLNLATQNFTMVNDGAESP